jgi:hypothetical protein
VGYGVDRECIHLVYCNNVFGRVVVWWKKRLRLGYYFRLEKGAIESARDRVDFKKDIHSTYKQLIVQYSEHHRSVEYESVREWMYLVPNDII